MTAHSTSRDLILVTVHQVNFDYVAPFILSLKHSGYHGQVAMFVSCMDAASVAKLQQQGVKVIPFRFAGKKRRQRWARLWPLWRWYFRTRASAESKIWLAHRVFHLLYRRFLLYADYLREHGSSFDRVFLADARDVYFQADPFAWEISPGLHFFLEEAKQRIGGCRLHQLWMGCQFGRAFVEQHAERNVSCSGTVFGGTAEIQEYVAQMVATMMSARDLAKIDGGDQGIHNYLIIQKLPKLFTVHENRRGPVLTMGVMTPADFQQDARGFVLNEDGQIAPVLHQYDRLPELKQRLVARL